MTAQPDAARSSEGRFTLSSVDLIQQSAPRSPQAHWQYLGDHGQLLVVNGTRIYEVSLPVLEQFEAASARGDEAVHSLLQQYGLFAPDLIGDEPIDEPPLRAISLAIAQQCNLGCSYCYAGQGEFGGTAKRMSVDTARRAVQLLLSEAPAGSKVNIAFMGGEPLANRPAIYEVTDFAAHLGQQRGVQIGFSITTNGTLLREADAAFFEDYEFAVTVSLDGLREVHDRQRPFKKGGGSFDSIMSKIQPLLARQRRMQVSVRCTVMPGQYDLLGPLDYFLRQGFHSVGFSPVLHSSNGQGEFSEPEFAGLLDAMVQCGLEWEGRLVRGQRCGFANLMNALREIHRGTHRPYPCGAGAGYLGVSAEGELAACHRFVGDEVGKMGDVSAGVDRLRQSAWLRARHVHTQTPCSRCWARYMCGGGCHHEVMARGRTACDYIRGWLLYCLQAYDRVLTLKPEWFGVAERPPG